MRKVKNKIILVERLAFRFPVFPKNAEDLGNLDTGNLDTGNLVRV
jgi:hypothetical protein